LLFKQFKGGKNTNPEQELRLEEIIDRISLINDYYNGVSVKGHLDDCGIIAVFLAPQVGADPEISHLGAKFHDLGAILGGRDNHEILGAYLARMILRYLGFDEDKIDAVVNCVLSHRSSIDNFDELTLEQMVVRAADALSHFRRVIYLWEEEYQKRVILDKATFDDIKGKLAKKFAKDLKKPCPSAQARMPTDYTSWHLPNWKNCTA
jgi:HD superfamily phosphodiesterase